MIDRLNTGSSTTVSKWSVVSTVHGSMNGVSVVVNAVSSSPTRGRTSTATR